VTSVPLSEGASIPASPPTKAADPVVKIDPAVVEEKKEGPDPPPPPPVEEIVICPFEADATVIFEPAAMNEVPSDSCVSAPDSAVATILLNFLDDVPM
jgi:hypothetical protein